MLINNIKNLKVKNCELQVFLKNYFTMYNFLPMWFKLIIFKKVMYLKKIFKEII